MPGKNFAGVSQQLIQQIKFLLWQQLVKTATADRQCVIVQRQITADYFALIINFGAAQQRTNAQQHFVNVDGLYHIVVGTGQKSTLLIKKSFTGRHHQHRQRKTRLPQRSGQLTTIHIGH
ncbi:hypothetical protein SDC9_186993 [bioreactor metagenome]|uniref:Uncharacterized protein n=1 Tax=bioreactor metagenome TaxID=1076179 RepID=A0A645HKC4_9ZZZZ